MCVVVAEERGYVLCNLQGHTVSYVQLREKEMRDKSVADLMLLLLLIN